jgi:hypothetical protein
MKQVYTRLVMVPVKVTVEFNQEEGFYYAMAPSYASDNLPRPAVVIVRSADKETALNEVLIAAGYGASRA